MRYSKLFLRAAVVSILWFSAGYSPAAEPAGFNVQLHIRNLASSDRTIRREASLRLSQAGGPEARDAVPALIKALDDQDDQVWFNTVTALARIGPDAREAVPALMKQLTTSNQNRYARQAWLRTSFALGSIGPEALPALREALKSGQPHVRSGAAKAITWIGPDAVEVVPALLENLGDERADVREQTAEALGSIGQPALAPVLATLRSENPRARQGAALALEWLKHFASDSVPPLVTGLEQEKDDTTRASYVKALTRLRYTPNEFLKHLLPALGTDSAVLRQEIHNALLDMEPAGSTSVPALERILRDPASRLREPAAYLLGRIGPAASSAVPHLIAARITGEDPKLSAVCEAALVEIGAPSVPALIAEMSSSGSVVDSTAPDWAEECVFKIGEGAVPALTRALASSESSARVKSLRMLARLGKASAPAAGELAQFAARADALEKGLALQALAAIPAPADQLFPLAEQALRADDLVLRRAGVRAMASLGKSARPALPVLIRALEDSDAPLAAGAAEAIARLGVAGESAVPVLLRRVEAPPLAVQVESARALGVLGEAARPALPVLLKLLAEAPVELRSVAADALGNMGETAREALPEIRKNLQSPDAPTRAASLQACLKIEGDAPRTLTPLLIQSLEDPAQAVRWLALESIGRFGSRAQSAEPAVFQRLDDADDRGLALAVLQQIRPNNVDLLVARLPHEDAQVRLFAVERLGQLGARASNAVEALEARRQDEYEPVSRAARASVRAIQRALSQPRNNQ